jgi:hypothetical protein
VAVADRKWEAKFNGEPVRSFVVAAPPLRFVDGRGLDSCFHALQEVLRSARAATPPIISTDGPGAVGSVSTVGTSGGVRVLWSAVGNAVGY